MQTLITRGGGSGGISCCPFFCGGKKGFNVLRLAGSTTCVRLSYRIQHLVLFPVKSFSSILSSLLFFLPCYFPLCSCSRSSSIFYTNFLPSNFLSSLSGQYSLIFLLRRKSLFQISLVINYHLNDIAYLHYI